MSADRNPLLHVAAVLSVEAFSGCCRYDSVLQPIGSLPNLRNLDGPTGAIYAIVLRLNYQRGYSLLKIPLLVALVCTFAGPMHLQAQMTPRPEKPVRTSKDLTLDDLVSAAKYYFRDSAELPMLQVTTLSVTDASGKSRKPQMQSMDYLFHGYSKKEKSGTVSWRGHESMWAALRGSKTMKASINSGFVAMLPGVLMYSDTSKFSFGSKRSVDAAAEQTASLAPKEPCPAFAMKQNKDEYFPDGLCGESRFQLDGELRLEQFTFEAATLPAETDIAPFGKCTLSAYHAEVEFQSVALPGDKDPFLVPKLVTTTLQTSKGTIVISSRYQPKPVK